MLAACLVLPFLLAILTAIGGTVGRQWLNRHPEVMSLYYCLGELEKLERSSGTDGDQAEDRRALEIYLAHHFGAVVNDPAVWSNLYTQNLFTPHQREIAERAVAEHGQTSEQELAGATARLQSFLDQMPKSWPGAPFADYQMLGLGVAMSLITMLLMLVVVPSLIGALLFRGGLLIYVFGVAVVNRDGTTASRLRVLWRSLVTWSPLVLMPVILVLLKISGLGIILSVCLTLALLVTVVIWSSLLPERGIPDRIAGTYLVSQ